MHRALLLPVLLFATASFAQTAPAFEVATIKRSPDFMVFSGFPQVGGDRFEASHVTLKAMVAYAYDVREFNVSGGPAWADSDRFEILAKTPTNTTLAQARAMILTLLNERFRLALRRETKESNIYQLTVAKGARPKLEESSEGSFLRFVGRGQVEGHAYPMSGLANYLQTLLAQTVVDKTGLTAKYNFKFSWAPDESQAGRPSTDRPLAEGASETGPSLFTALQEQLGLKLESAKGPVEVIVIDHAEKPSEN